MYITCLDLEGVLTPEIWIEFANAVGMDEFRRTTRDEPDYDKLMKFRIALMKERGIKLPDIQAAIEKMELLPGAKEFLDELRSFSQVIIVSDTFKEFAMPIMKKLGWPTIFCNELTVDPDGTITGYRMRLDDSKFNTVKGLQSIGYDVISAGDSYNDLGMLSLSKAGFLFRSTDAIKAAHPEFEAFERYDELLAAIRKAMD